ncbi:MAG: GntR family transcriptional regulator [Alphaproteobacteria bacterium]|nr:GntR family transcriptional regulator [Alphaproteobacteria bacterium]
MLKAPKSLVDQAYEVILDAICDGTLKPGERLTQEMIAARLNVSRQPVTHALTLLKGQGLLREAGRRGLAVPPMDARLFDAIYQFRGAIEPLAVSLATPRLDEAMIARGRALLKQGREMVRSRDRRGLIAADMAFHCFIYEVADNQVIIDSMRLNWCHLRRSIGEVLRHPSTAVDVWPEHEAILDHMIAGRAEEAAALMRTHVTVTYKLVSRPARERASA